MGSSPASLRTRHRVKLGRPERGHPPPVTTAGYLAVMGDEEHAAIMLLTA